MRNIIIGIVSREETISDTTIEVITRNNLKYLHNKCSYIGILNYDKNDIDEIVLSLCDGIIFQGGNNIHPYHYKILEYAINNNIPVLGICMGMQLIGLYNQNKDENKLIKINNHYSKENYHNIKILNNTYMHKLYGNNLKVNSRHLYALPKVNKPLKISALSEDNIIEAIEYIDDNNFILGVQFHPEDMETTEVLYNNFIKEIIKRKDLK